MLQRAASNAYSWWWASHIRTKQSKWLEQSLQDMEDKVKSMLTLIQEDGDSFAKRAEMYYKRRPELILSVEEAYKAFRALADRYDLLSKELQNANHTIATVFPEQVQFDISEVDEDYVGPPPPNIIPSKTQQIPEVPKKAPNKNLKRIIAKASKEIKDKKKAAESEQKSGLTKEEALEEINKIQKDILALQTVKEFVKSSYENGVAKYWGIESQITEMQKKVSKLQDEFDMDVVIEDDEARRLMAEAALKSCQETLILLQEKQEKSTREAKEEYKRIEAACQRLQTLKQKYMQEQQQTTYVENNESQKDVIELILETKEIEGLNGPAQESCDLGSNAPLSVSQLAEKIDQLVNKVIGLETAVSSQTVLVSTLKTETDDLNNQIRNLEEEKENLVDDTQVLSTRVREMEGRLNKIQDLNKNVESRSSNLQTNFAEARSNLDRLSEKLTSVKPDEEIEEVIKAKEDVQILSASDKKPGAVLKTEATEEVKEVDKNVKVCDLSVPEQGMVQRGFRKSITFMDRKPKEATNAEKEDDVNWQMMLLSGMEDKEKVLLKEYTTILRNYKEVKKKLTDMEKKEKDSQFDTVLQIRDLKRGMSRKDEEIQNLKQRLNFQGGGDINLMNEHNNPVANEDDEEEIKLIFIDRTPSISRVEEKLRTDIDAILDENLDFWLRFSSAFHQIQKFKTEAQDLQDEISKIREKRKPDGSMAAQAKSEARPVYKHLREIQRELGAWLDQSASLKDELKRRNSSLCGIQEEIAAALREGVEGDAIGFSSHQAAKFQGETLSMKQENSKVREELQAGLDHARVLQVDIEKTLRSLDEEFGISGGGQSENLSRPRVPLRSFLFGTKVKKPKQSIFACMHPSRRYQILKAGIRLSKIN
ncbi:hypothetical protein ABFS82_08G219800 [Erythranthe guttata]